MVHATDLPMVRGPAKRGRESGRPGYGASLPPPFSASPPRPTYLRAARTAASARSPDLDRDAPELRHVERVPLLGAYSLVLVGRLERSAAGRSVELARLHGTFLSWTTRDLPESRWQKLLSSRPYLFLERDLVVPLFPMCAASASGAEWHVGWYARQVHKPTVIYQRAGGQEFQLALAHDDLASLARGARSAYRVIRGGSFNRAASDARSAIRNANPPERRSDLLGLRPARASRLSPSPLHRSGK